MVRNIWLHRYAAFTAACTWFLLIAGALVTSTGSGLAVPDWPLSFGQFFPPMVGGVLFEHGHRLVAGTVAILTFIQAVLFGRYETRVWVKRLAWIAFGMVLLQASLGGMTVLLKLPPQVSITHACLAQLFFCTMVTLAFVTSSIWCKKPVRVSFDEKTFLSLPATAVLITVGFFLQLLVGATMRHNGAGLAIPDFPTAFGGIFPPRFDFKIAIHYLHRVGAFTLVGLVSWQAFRVSKQYMSQFALVAFSGALVALVTFQFLMGAMVVWMKKPVPVTSLHLAVGALCFATSLVFTLHVFRIKETNETLEPNWVPA